MTHDFSEITIYADGGARGNPGPAAYGFVAYDKNHNKLVEKGERIGITTNNVAEYQAVISALKWAAESVSRGSLIQFFLDSKLVAHQLAGKFKVKDENLRNLYFTAKQLEEKIGGKVFYTAVKREQNKEADRLVNLALDSKI